MTLALVSKASGYVRMHARPIWHYLENDDIIEVAVNPDGSVWIEARDDHHMVRANERFEGDVLIELAAQLAGSSGSELGHQNLIVSTMIEVEGSPMRAQAVVPPATGGIGSLTIRKFPKFKIASKQITIQPNVSHQSISDAGETLFEAGQAFEEAAEFIVSNRLTCIVSGGTGSGKTTLLKAILDHVDKEERVITIEDVPEIILDIPNFITLQADRELQNRSPKKLLESVMRMRPDRFLIGELRGTETMTFLEAVNTGHPGSFTTVHANSAELAINRLVLMCLAAAPNMTPRMVVRNIIDSIDVIVHSSRNGNKRGPSEFFFPKENSHDLLDKFK